MTDLPRDLQTAPVSVLVIQLVHGHPPMLHRPITESAAQDHEHQHQPRRRRARSGEAARSHTGGMNMFIGGSRKGGWKRMQPGTSRRRICRASAGGPRPCPAGRPTLDSALTDVHIAHGSDRNVAGTPSTSREPGTQPSGIPTAAAPSAAASEVFLCCRRFWHSAGEPSPGETHDLTLEPACLRQGHPA